MNLVFTPFLEQGFRMLAGVLIFICFTIHQVLLAQGNSFIIQNKSGYSRTAGPVVISRENLKQVVSISEKKTAALYINDELIPSQMDDLTGDGQWDEIAFQADIERNSELSVRVKWVSAENAPILQAKVYAGLGLKDATAGKFSPVQSEMQPDNSGSANLKGRYQYEGPILESEKVAFRHIFDDRMFTTALGKFRPQILKDTFQLAEGLQSWGMELIPSDSGMGLGGFALESGGSFRRIQGAGATFYRLLANGPVRSVFDLIYEDWEVDGQMVNVRQRHSIWAGQEGFNCELTINGFEGEKDVLVNMPVLAEAAKVENMVLNKAIGALAWHAPPNGKRPGHLGLGMLFSKAGLKAVVLPQDASVLGGLMKKNAGVKFRITSGQTLEYRYLLGWQKSNEYYGNAVQFKNVLSQSGNELENPLKISAK